MSDRNLESRLAQCDTPQPGERAAGGDEAWREALWAILRAGQVASPRQMETVELLHSQVVSIDMRRAVVASPERKLSYPFMAAEALWILGGDDRLEPLVKHVPRMAQFSDDGVTLAGAYGPRVVAQLKWVVGKLLQDRDTRQAALTIWDRNPAPSRDIPCTIAMTFAIRKNELHQHVFMRSSDAWLGLPYDMFSFACVGIRVACLYNSTARESPIGLGTLTIAATSSHLYARDSEGVKRVLESQAPEVVASCPDDLVATGDWETLEVDLKRVESGGIGEAWRIRP